MALDGPRLTWLCALSSWFSRWHCRRACRSASSACARCAFSRHFCEYCSDSTSSSRWTDCSSSLQSKWWLSSGAVATGPAPACLPACRLGRPGHTQACRAHPGPGEHGHSIGRHQSLCTSHFQEAGVLATDALPGVGMCGGQRRGAGCSGTQIWVLSSHSAPERQGGRHAPGSLQVTLPLQPLVSREPRGVHWLCGASGQLTGTAAAAPRCRS